MNLRLHLLAAALLCGTMAGAADLTALGTWVATISSQSLTGGAGSGLAQQVESLTAVTTLTISNTSGAWSLRAHRSGGHEHGDVTVYVRRTSNGTGTGTIAGGSGYVELTTADAELFSGSENRNGVTLQFKISGVSHRLTPDTYFSNIVFTIQ